MAETTARLRINKIRELVRHEQPRNVFKWQNLCKDINLTNRPEEIREMAKTFGVPPQFWDTPRKVCQMITPRVSDYLETRHCDNNKDMTMDLGKVGDIPEYLKYAIVSTSPTGKVTTRCYSILDLYRSVQRGQVRDPFTREPLNKDDIEDRYNFLLKVIEPHGMGLGTMAQIENTPLSPRDPDRVRLLELWGTMNYPPMTADQVWESSPQQLEQIFNALMRTLPLRRREHLAFRSVGDPNTRRRVLIDIMSRIIRDDGADALEIALNQPNPDLLVNQMGRLDLVGVQPRANRPHRRPNMELPDEPDLAQAPPVELQDGRRRNPPRNRRPPGFYTLPDPHLPYPRQ
jgi:hypothetical protein